MQSIRISRKEIADGFRALGVRAGGILLVHSSLKSFGQVGGGADAVIDGLLDAIGTDGTLLAPTLTGSEALSPENPPHIDLRTTPCWLGAIPEALRKRPNAVRSVHPTHSCAAIGKRAEALTRGHELSPTPCGLTSPYFRVAQAGGSIVMAGCGLDRCTTFHTVEEIANAGYHLQDRVAHGSCVDASGARIETPCRLHSYNGPQRDFPVMEPILLDKGLMRIGQVCNSTVRIADAMGLIESSLERVRFDPYFLTVLRGKEIASAPKAKAELVTTHLQMFAPPAREKIRPKPDGLSVVHLPKVPIHFYRYLYNTISEPWVWWERKLQTDDQIKAEVHSDAFTFHVPYLQGVPIGMMELDNRCFPEVQLNYYGLFPEYCGRGIGGYLLDWLAEDVFARGAKRFWVHTCSFDSPRAIPAYQSAGFVIFDVVREWVDDPRAS